ncbi:citryl-CoA lyase [Microbacterium aerolatum]|uniref:citryl-CoA lyase n=1 Tax=Microbacterium aerolatum TaxID=153731 RepID=UPI002001A83E|nr:citryl-CoA lyase [Microbacterium aerolatum]MCK3771133.1 citryl-CoA lyase [Microbacterium aerolatum]
MMDSEIGTAIAVSTTDAIYIRGKDLVQDLMGKVDFTSMTFFHLRGRFPTDGERTVLDATLVAVMEHGLTPSSITARLIYSSSPDAMQSAVAAGLLGAGSAFLGVMEDFAHILQDGVLAIQAKKTTAEDFARTTIEGYLREGKSVPGFGHHIHRPDDPRTPRLLQIASDSGVSGMHAELLGAFGAAMDELKERHVTVNATGAVAAVLSDIGFSWKIVRGFALIGRSAGLVGHIAEEQERPLGRAFWAMAEENVPYLGERPGHD